MRTTQMENNTNSMNPGLRPTTPTAHPVNSSATAPTNRQCEKPQRNSSSLEPLLISSPPRNGEKSTRNSSNLEIRSTSPPSAAQLSITSSHHREGENITRNSSNLELKLLYSSPLRYGEKFTKNSSSLEILPTGPPTAAQTSTPQLIILSINCKEGEKSMRNSSSLEMETLPSSPLREGEKSTRKSSTPD